MYLIRYNVSCYLFMIIHSLLSFEKLVWEPPTVKRALPNRRSPWQLQCPLVDAPPSDKSIKMQTSGRAESVTDTLTSRHQYSSDSTPPAIASAHQASRYSRSFASPPVLPSLAQASCCGRSFARHPAGAPACITGLPRGRLLAMMRASPTFRQMALFRANDSTAITSIG
jgi:hypothetical protein